MCQTCVCEEFEIVSGKAIDQSRLRIFTADNTFSEISGITYNVARKCGSFHRFFFAIIRYELRKREKDPSYNFDKWFSWKIERVCPRHQLHFRANLVVCLHFSGLQERTATRWNEIKEDAFGNKKENRKATEISEVLSKIYPFMFYLFLLRAQQAEI